MTAWPKYVVFDRALPLSQSAVAMVCAPETTQAMSPVEKLGAALITELLRMDDTADRDAATSHVRAAVMLTRGVACDRADP